MGTKYKGNKREIAVLDSLIKLRRATTTIESELTKNLAKYSLTPSQFGVLDVLYNLEKINQKVLAEKLFLSSSNIVTVIDNLEKVSFVERKRDESDRRNFYIILTPAGEKKYLEIFPTQLKEILKRFEGLNEAELASLGKICKKIGKAPHNTK